MTKYDEIRYPTYVHSQINPDRLATVGHMFGLEVAPADSCRYLELGCGDAGTLIANAAALPDSTFIGVDLAATSVERANEIIAAIGLTNIEIICADVADLPQDLGEFDYVTSHGVFSWVPEEARLGMLKTCRERLRRQGVAYVSYNAHPAGHLREITRAMLRYHLSRREIAPEEAHAESVSLLGFLSEARPKGDIWGEVLEGELAYLRNRHPAGLLHDELADINQQFWFYEFMELAAAQGLQFIAESDDLGLPGLGWSESVQELFKALENDPLQREQYYDFVAARRFRQTLLCRDDVELVTPADPLRLRGCNVLASTTSLERVDLSKGAHMVFLTEDGQRPGSDNPITKAALITLGYRYPEAIAFPELLAESRRVLGEHAAADEDQDESDLASSLVHLQATRCVSFSRMPRRWPTKASERPVTSALARHQLDGGAEVVATLLAEQVQLSEASRAVCLLTDGTHDAMQIAVEIGADPKEVESSLDALAQLGLFSA